MTGDPIEDPLRKLNALLFFVAITFLPCQV